MPRFITKTHTEEITPDHVSYRVHTEGSVEPFNDEIVIENIGTARIESPVVTVNGLYNWSTTEDIAREITRHCTTDEEKALAIFTWVRTHGDHQYSGDIQALNPVVFFNVFGYGICAYFASVQTALARAAGLQARVWEIYRHTVGEVFYDGQWHMLDPDMQLFFLNPDNRTIASIEQLEQDLAFFERTAAFQRTFQDAYGNVRHEHQSKPDTFRYDLKHPRYVQYDYDPHIYATKTMDYTLFPGETLVRAWKGNGKHNDYREQSRFKLNEEEPHKTWPPVHYGNGSVLYAAAFDQHGKSDLFETRNVKLTERGLTVEVPQDSRDGSRSLLVYRRPLPYLIVGGHIRGEAFRDGDTAYDHVSLVGYKKTGRVERKELYRQTAPGRHRFEIDLDEFLYPGKDDYAYEHGVHVVLGAYSGNEPGSTTGVTQLEVKTDFQLQPRSLPALTLGENAVWMLHRPPADRGFR
ncbi:MAG: transglutaminase domain-containing protein, partial [Candidatus Latescibacteria bacterium]|nr:transglutaminase domain-containing protein [Candidatus Latescibacterota bacterium]